ncbi:MAG: GIY-YIG nuclease family protein [Candidatus Omnitrophica bacterium]|nr:GIY-YIG nuclease family protein [Candidatus Omnitrophota bacterium]MBU4140327.1 GIY-YIG nuclease family protein [Candidatus Omnitrophota bacterium]
MSGKFAVTCNDANLRDKTLYVGVAKDAHKRITDHNETDKCRYTRFRKPLELMYQELCQSYNMARKRESEIKKFSRKKKFDLINSKQDFFA